MNLIMVESRETVLITGVTGYLGIYVLKDLLTKHPNFKVRASVRSLGNKEKMAKLEVALGKDLFEQVEFAEADLSDERTIHEAVKGMDHILHIANPVPGSGVLNEANFIEPVRIGTRAILEACKTNKVKTLVITSSIVV